MNTTHKCPDHPVAAKNPIAVLGDLAMIGLTQGYHTRLSSSRLPLIAQHRWCAQVIGGVVYAATTIGGRTVAMHTLICSTSATQPHVDHRNGNGLDNRDENLRPCSNLENRRNVSKNCKNASGYRGVRVIGGAGRERYKSFVRVAGRQIALGTYRTADAAARAYDQAAAEHFLDFARINFPATGSPQIIQHDFAWELCRPDTVLTMVGGGADDRDQVQQPMLARAA